VKTCQEPQSPPSFSEVATSEREHQRYAHEAAITVHALGKKLEGRTTNVSRGGLCADLESAVKFGTDVEVELQLVFDHDEKSDALIMPARVVWCTTVDEGFQIGLSFKPLTAEKTRMMALFLRYLDDGGKPVKQPKGERNIDDQFG
jgi:hypothetical protein